MPDSPIQFVFMLFADDVFDPIIQFIQSTVKGFHCLVSNISHSSICSLLNGKPKIDLGGNTVVIDRLKKNLTRLFMQFDVSITNAIETDFTY